METRINRDVVGTMSSLIRDCHSQALLHSKIDKIDSHRTNLHLHILSLSDSIR